MLRVLSFPEDYSVGELSSLDQPGSLAPSQTWAARGIVRVPVEVSLSLLWDSPNDDLSPLDSLATDDLAGLSFGKFYRLVDNEMAHVQRLSTLVYLELSNNDITIAGLPYIAGLTTIQELGLECGKGLSSAGLVHLRRLIHLRYLNLATIGVDDDDLEHLRHFRQLETLSLAYTQASDKGLRWLSSLTRLSRLGLRHTLTTDLGLRAVSILDGLSELDLSFTGITNAGLESTVRLERLAVLNLESTALDDDGIGHILALGGLRELNLRGTRISVSGALLLAQLPELRRLVIPKEFGLEGWERLSDAMPNCEIVKP
jgi:Leucine Rich repeat